MFRRLAGSYWPVLLGVLALALPTLASLATQVWSTEDGAHGPIVLASGLWLLGRQWKEIRSVADAPPLGQSVLLLVPACLLYVFGRMVGVLGIEAFALAAILVGLLYGYAGSRALRLAWFPIFYLAFLIPLPDTIVYFITQPMKLAISDAAASILYAVGYPVVNTGVTLQVAQYELLVAAACSGLNAIISLSAIGLFYIYLMHRSSWRYALVLMMAVVPAAIFANFIRVIALILITYHLGDEAAQGFLHNVAGIVTFIVALSVVVGVDGLLTPLRKRLEARHGN